jgi:hypothetical protein
MLQRIYWRRSGPGRRRVSRGFTGGVLQGGASLGPDRLHPDPQPPHGILGALLPALRTPRNATVDRGQSDTSGQYGPMQSYTVLHGPALVVSCVRARLVVSASPKSAIAHGTSSHPELPGRCFLANHLRKSSIRSTERIQGRDVCALGWSPGRRCQGPQIHFPNSSECPGA